MSFIADIILSSMVRKPKPLKPEQGQEGSEEDRLAGVLKRLARLLGRAYAREWLAKGNDPATEGKSMKEKSSDADEI